MLKWKRFQWKKHNLFFKRPLHGQKKMGKKLVEMYLFALESWKLLSRFYLPPNSLFSKKLWNSRISSIYVIHNKPLPCKAKFVVHKHALWHTKLVRFWFIWSHNVFWINLMGASCYLMQFLQPSICVVWCTTWTFTKLK